MSKTYLKDVNFDFDEEEFGYPAHIAYCSKAVGGAASKLNQAILLKSDDDVKITKESLGIMKAAKEIRIEMSFEDFLKKFFDLWYDEAAMLAKMLGFESSIDEESDYKDYSEMMEDKLEAFTILKSLNESDKKDFYSLELQEQKQVLKVQELFEKGLQDYEAIKKGLDEGNPEGIPSTAKGENSLPDDKVNKTNNKVGDEMTDKTTDKDNVEFVELKKSVESLQKALNTEKAKREALEQKENKRVEEGFINKAKGYTFVEDAEAFGKILKGLDEVAALEILKVLDKAKDSMDDQEKDMFIQKSVSGETKEVSEGQKKKKDSTRDALIKQLNLEIGE